MKDCKSKNCKHYKRNERIGIKVCEFDLFHESYCEKDKEDFAIEELEKIKAEIEEEDSDCQYEEDYVYNGGLQTAIEIIDKHIFKLKGEKE